MKPLNVYACYNLNDKIRLESSSGAVFSCLADYVIENQGIVYGVVMSEDCYFAEYKGITCKEEISKLRGSKYLQAKIGKTYREVKKNLMDGKLVLFSGTGCQINGLKYFLAENYDNLICVDVICHGVPSPALWKKYVRFQEERNRGKLVNINFRCKDKNWQEFGMKEMISLFSKKKIKQKYISKDVDSYMQMFLCNYCLRPSCYECVAKNEKLSDITLADFWGIDTVLPGFNDKKGTSLLLIRTEKGKKFFNNIREQIRYKEVSYEDGVKKNPAEYCSAHRPVERDNFYKNMQNMTFNQLEQLYNLPIKMPISIKLKIKVANIINTYILNGGCNVNYGLLFRFSIDEEKLL